MRNNPSFSTNGKPWAKKNSRNSFDVTMGSYDGAETCELVGSYLLSQLPETIDVGLYRDDGLGISRQTPRRTDQIKKKICKVFTNNGLKITIEANKKVVNFLDVTLDLNKEAYEPYAEPNNTPLYVHRDSDHPPSILRNIPLAINKRLSKISSTREAFERAAPEYQEALNKSGYGHQLRYQPTTAQPRPGPRKRQRNITWYNPSYSQSVATNVGKKFLGIVNDTFKKDHPLRKIFNRNTLRLSYSCMTNLGSNINAHNKSVINEKPRSPEKTCNCRFKPACPLNGKCLTSNIIYQATVESDGGSETYIGLTANEFKTRYRNHTTSFRHESEWPLRN